MSVSNYDYPEDEFDVGDDDGPVPVGVHRAQVPRWRSWVPLLAIIIIVPALAWGAVTLIINGKRIWETFSGSSDAVSSTQPAQGGQAAGKKDEGKKDLGQAQRVGQRLGQRGLQHQGHGVQWDVHRRPGQGGQ